MKKELVITEEMQEKATVLKNEIKAELNTIVVKTSRVARLVGSYCDCGFKPADLTEETGLSRTTLSKMNIAAKGYENLVEQYIVVCNQDDINRLLDVPYTFIYNHAKEIEAGEYYGLSVDEVIERLSRKKLTKTDSEEADSEEADSEEADSEEVYTDENSVTITLDTGIALFIADCLDIYASDLESSEDGVKVINKVIKMIRRSANED